MDWIIGALKNEKISSSVLVIIITLAFWAHGWANEEFVKKDEFETLQTTVSEGFESIEINDASQIIRDLKLKIMITKATAGDMGNLWEELTQAQKYKECLVKREPNCEHIEDLE